MKQPLKKLWTEVFDDGVACPFVDPAAVQKRVDARLSPSAPAQKRYIHKKCCAIAICAALLIVLTGTVLAAYYRSTALTYFDGDTSLIEPAVQPVGKVMETESYQVTVDSVLSDANNTVVGLSITGLTDEAAAVLHDEEFSTSVNKLLRFRAETVDTYMIAFAYLVSPADPDSSTRNVNLHIQGVGAPNTLQLSLVDGEESDSLVLTLDSVLESLSVTAQPSDETTDYFIRSCQVDAIGVALEVEFAQPVNGDRSIEFCFRMADGSLKTLSQLCGAATRLNTSLLAPSDENAYRYEVMFTAVIDPETITGVLMNGMEYSFLDSEDVRPAEIPASMQPFLTPYLEIDDGVYFSAYDVCAHIGAAVEAESGQYTIRYLDLTVTLRPDDTAILVNGEKVELKFPPIVQNGDLLLPQSMFDLLRLVCDMYYPEIPAVVSAPDYWLVTP